MEKLESTVKICVNHLRVMNHAYVPDCELRHRNCSGLNTQCEDYKPYSPQTNIPIKQGAIAYALNKR